MKNNKILPFSVFENIDPDIGIENTDEIVTELNKLLSNHFILFLKMWNFHWIVVSKKFRNIHEHFNELYDKFFDNIDKIAERIRSLGGKPLGTYAKYIENSELKEYSDEYTPGDSDMIKKVLVDYETIIKQIRKILENEKIDNGTSKLLEDFIEDYEKDAWMLRSNLAD